MRFRVLRQDDNGNVVEVAAVDTRAAADALAAAYEARAHKQLYWVEPAAERAPDDRDRA